MRVESAPRRSSSGQTASIRRGRRCRPISRRWRSWPVCWAPWWRCCRWSPDRRRLRPRKPLIWGSGDVAAEGARQRATQSSCDEKPQAHQRAVPGTEDAEIRTCWQVHQSLRQIAWQNGHRVGGLDQRCGPPATTHKAGGRHASLSFIRLAAAADGSVVEAAPETPAPARPPIGFDRCRR